MSSGRCTYCQKLVGRDRDFCNEQCIRGAQREVRVNPSQGLSQIDQLISRATKGHLGQSGVPVLPARGAAHVERPYQDVTHAGWDTDSMYRDRKERPVAKPAVREDEYSFVKCRMPDCHNPAQVKGPIKGFCSEECYSHSISRGNRDERPRVERGAVMERPRVREAEWDARERPRGIKAEWAGEYPFASTEPRAEWGARERPRVERDAVMEQVEIEKRLEKENMARWGWGAMVKPQDGEEEDAELEAVKAISRQEAMAARRMHAVDPYGWGEMEQPARRMVEPARMAVAMAMANPPKPPVFGHNMVVPNSSSSSSSFSPQFRGYVSSGERDIQVPDYKVGDRVQTSDKKEGIIQRIYEKTSGSDAETGPYYDILFDDRTESTAFFRNRYLGMKKIAVKPTTSRKHSPRRSRPAAANPAASREIVVGSRVKYTLGEKLSGTVTKIDMLPNGDKRYTIMGDNRFEYVADSANRHLGIHL